MSAPFPSANALSPSSGRFIEGVHHFPVRIYFEDTDAGGIVYHANYLRYMERARSDMLRLLGIDQRASIETGEGVYAVTRVEIEYRAPAKLDDDLIVVSRMERVSGATVTIAQQVMRGEVLLTEAAVTVAFITPEGRPKRQPRAWVEIYKSITNGEPVLS
ncbi:MAG: tol-pal system-associated acyl-CoA thioesterase [Sphingobium sp.]|jgi:acyl-CoA thioester hydrolase|nr:tol-pal system-associated acyl-CoA thioesterase [Sphingobium sp.]MCI1272168.1 tol-pal system-associated acyl-CoA thioesterase [Sphingobium sp.]MCI1756787.1 tol-pal system-associated acyl-CoA thioesterase [Sphingobium sp.]MCI2052378.1 tol-pal system-associated acyl-CoA thioesterase [Sphingobium sp.]